MSISPPPPHHVGAPRPSQTQRAPHYDQRFASIARHYEISLEMPIGRGSIFLAPNALRALDHVVGVYDHLKAAAFSYRRLAMHADDGYLFGHLVQYDDEYDALHILRSTLHNIILDACEKQPDLVQVHYGDILIGADGIHSNTSVGTAGITYRSS
ncbi:hypothetical protein B0H14DRAFT_3523446 [Mycena olivaceomarginata]|nr:hypothetical protein B0H14DRAFT_3523446 [Mycena olivaceomarginata]